jgi:putative transposase
MQSGIKRGNVQRDFLKFTSQRIKDRLKMHYPGVLSGLEVNAKDRKYQIWERNSLSVDLWSENVMMEKIRYVHENPVRAGLCSYSDEYKYSSALLYKTGIDMRPAHKTPAQQSSKQGHFSPSFSQNRT